jgi:hypothetical protein
MQKLCFVLMLAVGGVFILPGDQAQARPRHHHIGKHHHVLKKKVSNHRKKLSQHKKNSAAHSVSLAGVTPVLAAKTRQIVAKCGSVVIGGVSRRNGRSNHPIGRAVDLAGNPGCIYAQLKGWPGGYSTDYSAVRHVHISYNPGGQEWGLRFAHNGSRKGSVTRVAHNSSRESRAAEFAYSASRRNGAKHFAYGGSRKSRALRHASRGPVRYAMQPAISTPTPPLHSVH